MTPDDVVRFIERHVAGMEDENARREQREVYAEMAIPETMPVHAVLKTEDIATRGFGTSIPMSR